VINGTDADRNDGKLNSDIEEVIVSALNSNGNLNKNNEGNKMILNLFLDSFTGTRNMSARYTNKRVIMEDSDYTLNPCEIRLPVSPAILRLWKYEVIINALSFGKTEESVDIYQIKVNHFNPQWHYGYKREFDTVNWGLCSIYPIATHNPWTIKDFKNGFFFSNHTTPNIEFRDSRLFITNATGLPIKLSVPYGEQREWLDNQIIKRFSNIILNYMIIRPGGLMVPQTTFDPMKLDMSGKPVIYSNPEKIIHLNENTITPKNYSNIKKDYNNAILEIQTGYEKILRLFTEIAESNNTSVELVIKNFYFDRDHINETLIANPGCKVWLVSADTNEELELNDNHICMPNSSKRSEHLFSVMGSSNDTQKWMFYYVGPRYMEWSIKESYINIHIIK
jgi:hypothetical protein